MRRQVVLVSCVGAKRDYRCAAKDLYISAWFLKARRYAELNARTDGDWYILSALYGLVHHEAVIAPYEKTLNEIGKGDRLRWSRETMRQISANMDVAQTDFLILAGEKYRAFIVPLLLDAGATVEIPMTGLPIGKQLAWLDAAVISS